MPEGKRFYVGTVRESINGHESKKAMANQTALFTALSKQSWSIKTRNSAHAQRKLVLMTGLKTTKLY